MEEPPPPLSCLSEEKSPFDLSSAIQLLRSLSSYHPVATPPLTPASSDPHPVLQSIYSHQITPDPSRRNPFLDILSSSDSSTTKIPEINIIKSDSSNDSTVSTSSTVTPTPSKKRPRKTTLSSTALATLKRRSGFLTSLYALDFKPSKKPVHVFVDYSNISIGFYDSIKPLLPSSSPPTKINLSFHTLALILERRRTCLKKVLVGSTRNTDLKLEAEGLNYEVSILQRVTKHTPSPSPSKSSKSSKSSGSRNDSRGYYSEPESRKKTGEQAVDEVIIMKMLESLIDCPPSTIVLATGDGNITEFSEGFFKTVERALQKGWSVEVVAFKRTVSKAWKKLVGHDKFRVILLDEFLLDLLQP